MKFKKTFAISALAIALAGCSASSTSSKVSSSTSVSEASSASSAVEEEEIVTSGKYTITNTTGETVTELYLYETGTEDKGTNYAEGGLANNASVTIEIEVDEEKATDYASTLEFTTESGQQSQFTTLHLEEASLNLLSSEVDAYTSATPFEWAY